MNSNWRPFAPRAADGLRADGGRQAAGGRADGGRQAGGRRLARAWSNPAKPTKSQLGPPEIHYQKNSVLISRCVFRDLVFLENISSHSKNKDTKFKKTQP